MPEKSTETTHNFQPNVPPTNAHLLHYTAAAVAYDDETQAPEQLGGKLHVLPSSLMVPFS